MSYTKINARAGEYFLINAQVGSRIKPNDAQTGKTSK